SRRGGSGRLARPSPSRSETAYSPEMSAGRVTVAVRSSGATVAGTTRDLAFEASGHVTATERTGAAAVIARVTRLPSNASRGAAWGQGAGGRFEPGGAPPRPRTPPPAGGGDPPPGTRRLSPDRLTTRYVIDPASRGSSTRKARAPAPGARAAFWSGPAEWDWSRSSSIATRRRRPLAVSAHSTPAPPWAAVRPDLGMISANMV